MPKNRPEDIHLRTYCPSDLEGCITLWKVSSQDGHPFLSHDEIAADESLVRDEYIPMAEITVAWAGTRLVGFIAMIENFIGGLFVAPQEHRQGIGRALVSHEAERREHMSVEVYEANKKARDFYRSLGFIETSRRDSDDRGRPHPLIRMELSC